MELSLPRPRTPVIYTLDDEPTICEVLSEVLNAEGMAPRSFICPDDFFRAFSDSESGPDLIVLDVHMPETTGIKVCARFKKEYDKKDEIPVLFLTGYGNHQDAVSGFLSGGVDYITKPFDRKELMARINTHLQLKFAREELKKQNLKLLELNERHRLLQKIIFRNVPYEVHKESLNSADEGRFELTESRVKRAYMFVDIVGFTSFSEEKSPEETLEELNSIFYPVTNLIYQFGGDVNNFIGDCIFAVFDNPINSLECAKQIQNCAGNENSFLLRVGMTFGDSIRCNVGSKRRSGYTYIGKNVNLAQRLQSVARPGEVLCSEQFAAVTGFNEFSEPKNISLKGFSNSNKAFPVKEKADIIK